MPAPAPGTVPVPWKHLLGRWLFLTLVFAGLIPHKSYTEVLKWAIRNHHLPVHRSKQIHKTLTAAHNLVPFLASHLVQPARSKHLRQTTKALCRGAGHKLRNLHQAGQPPHRAYGTSAWRVTVRNGRDATPVLQRQGSWQPRACNCVIDQNVVHLRAKDFFLYLQAPESSNSKTQNRFSPQLC